MLQIYPFLRTATAIIPVALNNPGASTIAMHADTFGIQGWDVSFSLQSTSGNKNMLPDRPGEIDRLKLPTSWSYEKGDATAALARLRTFLNWGDNWDGEGAPAPEATSIESATVLLGLLSAELGRVPKIMLNGAGQPMFIAINDRFEIAVTVKSKSELSFFVAQGENENGGLVVFDGHQFPPDLKSAIRELRLA